MEEQNAIQENAMRQKRYMKSVMDMELFKYCGAVGMLWKPERCEGWNSLTEDPSSEYYVRCPMERSKWRFDNRQTSKMARFARRAMESDCIWVGFRKLEDLLDLAPELVRDHIEKTGKNFQKWIYEDKKRFLKYRCCDEPWDDVAMMALLQFKREGWPGCSD